MKYAFKLTKINKDNLFKLKEEDLLLITYPGRMGDEDGSTFIIKDNDSFVAYRVDGWMYPSSDTSGEYKISLEDMYKVFPKWKESVENITNDNYQGKYKHIYMGFGNSLYVDNSIYDKYYPYLLNEVKQNPNYKEENGSYNIGLNYASWDKAFVKMINKDN